MESPAVRDLVQRLQEVDQTLYQMSVCLNSWRLVCSDTQREREREITML